MRFDWDIGNEINFAQATSNVDEVVATYFYGTKKFFGVKDERYNTSNTSRYNKKIKAVIADIKTI